MQINLSTNKTLNAKLHFVSILFLFFLALEILNAGGSIVCAPVEDVSILFQRPTWGHSSHDSDSWDNFL